MTPSNILATMHGVDSNLGAIMLGGLFSTYFSGIVTMQVLLYHRLYPRDPRKVKTAIFGIWFVDLLHSGLVISCCWFWLVDNFGSPEIHDVVPWMASLTIILTSFITFTVHCFFCHRIYTLSKQRLWIVFPILLLALFRMTSALVTSSQLLRLRSFSKFAEKFRFMVSLGLSMAVAVDTIIALVICFFLNRRRTGFPNMDGVLNSITLYTVESGMITGVAAAASLIAWITMPQNLIWLAIHFAIGKLYANALLATLNARRVLRGRSQGSDVSPMPVMFPDGANARRAFSSRRDATSESSKMPMQISVEKTVERAVDGVPTVELPVISKAEEMFTDSDDPRSSSESQVV